MSSAPRSSSPFDRHALHGWGGARGGAQFPVTCAVYEEGSNLVLYMTPAGVGPLSAWLPVPADDLALVLETGQEEARLVRWAELAAFEGDADLVHLPAGTSGFADLLDQLPAPLLASVADALPGERGSRVALSVQDGCHGAVIARDPAILREALHCLLDGYLTAALGPTERAHRFDGPLLDSLLEPAEPGRCFELSLTARRRTWVLDVTSHGDEPGHAARWVCTPGGGLWRAWTWEEASAPLFSR